MYILAIAVNIVLIAIDQLTKHLAVTRLKPLETVPLIKGVFSLTFVENRGAAFGILQGARWFFVILTLIVLAGLVYYYVKLPKTKVYGYVRGALVLICAGAIGNFIDRFFNGYVIDFLHATFIEFPVFNMADIYVVVGTALLFFLLLFFIKDEKEKS